MIKFVIFMLFVTAFIVSCVDKECQEALAKAKAASPMEVITFCAKCSDLCASAGMKSCTLDSNQALCQCK